MSHKELLGVPAVRQVLAKAEGTTTPSEDDATVDKLKASCLNFDHSGKGRLSQDEFCNVIKLQNGIKISREEVIQTQLFTQHERERKGAIYDLLQTCHILSKRQVKGHLFVSMAWELSFCLGTHRQYDCTTFSQTNIQDGKAFKLQ